MVQKQDLQDCLSLFFFFFGGGVSKPSGIRTWESGNSSPIRISCFISLVLHVLLLGSFGRKSSILNLSPHFCSQSDGNESILYFRRGMISGDKVAPIIVQLVAFFLILEVCSRKFTCHLKRGPGTKTKRLVFLPLSFYGTC